MRKTYALLISLAFLTSCSSDDDSIDVCSEQVWVVIEACGETCFYSVEYGPDENNTTTIDTNEATFDYYLAIMNDDNELNCWEGEK
ncbi:hypothetical protein [Bizionia arctica]|uniref:Lipoprotein n=1 Tax=Bizionia arctica TaxID=1495645 RepID=A0A917GL82_9FLAO|nr:hypothetical protein [Bizionia arctica]GGG50648.1 hypothetical protein GCM10010976_22340 [Bizionia arctica]